MKKTLSCLAAAGVVFGVGMVPGKILADSARYAVVTPALQQYQPTLCCNGIVVAEGVKMLVSGNLVIKELLVEGGGWVEAGEVLAITQPPAPEDAFLSQSIDLPGGSISQSQLASMAAQYGVSVPEAGGLEEAALAEKLKTAMAAPQMAVAPISGILTWDAASPGRFLPAGSTLCTILGLDSYKAVVQVPAEQAALVLPGASAIITGSQIDNQRYSGTVLSVGSTVERGVTAGGYSATTEVEVLVEAPVDSMRHGASISCTILTGQPKNMLTLPYEAIHQDERNREYVYCVAGSRLQKKLVTTGQELDDAIEVQGLAPGDVVATGDSPPVARFLLEQEGAR